MTTPANEAQEELLTRLAQIEAKGTRPDVDAAHVRGLLASLHALGYPLRTLAERCETSRNIALRVAIAGHVTDTFLETPTEAEDWLDYLERLRRDQEPWSFLSSLLVAWRRYFEWRAVQRAQRSSLPLKVRRLLSQALRRALWYRGNQEATVCVQLVDLLGELRLRGGLRVNLGYWRAFTIGMQLAVARRARSAYWRAELRDD